MKKRILSILLSFTLTMAFLSTMTPTVSAASVTADDVVSLASAAQQAIGSSATDLGLPTGDWCGYFVGNRMNNSQIAARLGTTPYSACAYAISLVSWICATKDAGVFYVASPVHQNRLLEIDPRLGNSGRMVARTSSGWSPLPGDILQFSWSNWNLHTFDHTGIVVSVSGNMITYVDGNSSTGCVSAYTIQKDSSTIIGHIRFNMGSTPQSTPSTPVPSVPTVSSVEQGNWGVYIPANHYLPLDEKADSTTHISSVYARPTPYRIVCSERATLSDGTVRYRGVLNVPGSGDANFWFTYTTTMTVEDYAQPAHTEHTWDAGVETVSPALTTSGTRTYTCIVCGETKTESIPPISSVSGTTGSNIRWTVDSQGTLTLSGTGTVTYEPRDERQQNELREFVKHVVVQEGITALGPGSLMHLPNMVSVSLPRSLTTIAGDAFWSCGSLKEVFLPQNVSSLSTSAFRDCKSMTRIQVSQQNAYYCEDSGAVYTKDMKCLVCFPNGLGNSVHIPEGVTSISNGVFEWCLNIQELHLPRSVTSIGAVTFPGQGTTSSSPEKTDLVLVVPSGSYAERYAKEHNLNYQSTGPSATEAESSKPDSVKVELNLGTFKPDYLDRFKTVKTYRDGIFRDVNSSAWYRDNVAAAYELGLMKGTGESVFEPGKNVTIAETITLAARLHSTYYADGASFESYDGGNWYDPYVNYARSNGLLSENYDYSRPATREEFVHLLAKALPDEALQAITSTPAFDDANRIVYNADVELLSRAGVITGSTDGGVLRFRPDAPISRAEVAAVVTRMAKAELRKS